MYHTRLIVILLLLTLNIACAPKISSNKNSNLLFVTNIVDGDTFDVNDGSENGRRIRLIGVDAPESRKSRKKEVHIFGHESKIHLSEMILGKYVRLEYDVVKQDQYKRTLAYVFLEDGTFVNAELIRHGYAMIMTVPPNVKYADYFRKLQQRARRKRLGLWNEATDIH